MGTAASAPSPRAVPPFAGMAAIYDAVMGDAAAPLVWRAFRRSCQRYGIRFSSAADLGCGTGTFLAALAGTRPGRRLWGIDRSPQMLAIARQRLAGTGVQLLQQNFRRLSLPQPVDLVTCNFATMNYLPDIESLRALVERISINTVLNGHLVFDTLLQSGGSGQQPRFVQVIRLPQARARWTIVLEPDGSGSHVEMRTAMRSRRGGWRLFYETHHQRWFELGAVFRALQLAGWRVCGAHCVETYDTATARDRWVQFVARRR